MSSVLSAGCWLPRVFELQRRDTLPILTTNCAASTGILLGNECVITDATWQVMHVNFKSVSESVF